MDTATVITSIAGAVLGSTGLMAGIEAFAKRRNRKADATETLTDTAMNIVSALKADATESRNEAVEARKEAVQARQEAVLARQEAIEARAEGERARYDAITTHREILYIRDEVEKLTRKLRYIIDAIYDPNMTIHRLRDMIPYVASSISGTETSDPPSIEGHSS